MADKQVDISATEDSVAIGDSAGNLVSVTGNKLDVNAAIGAGGVVEAAEGPNCALRAIIMTFVQVGDVGPDYVAGSPGQLKTLKMYPTGAAGGSPAKITTIKYQDATYPTAPTSAIETATTV
jgi:hypothetical protein